MLEIFAKFKIYFSMFSRFSCLAELEFMNDPYPLACSDPTCYSKATPFKKSFPESDGMSPAMEKRQSGSLRNGERRAFDRKRSCSSTREAKTFIHRDTDKHIDLLSGEGKPDTFHVGKIYFDNLFYSPFCRSNPATSSSRPSRILPPVIDRSTACAIMKYYFEKMFSKISP